MSRRAIKLQPSAGAQIGGSVLSATPIGSYGAGSAWSDIVGQVAATVNPS